jgi:hypothetical protein
MLQLNERIAVTEALAVEMGATPHPRDFFALCILDVAQRQRFLQALPVSLSMPREYAEHAVALCLADRWNATPSWLESILTRINLMAQRADLAAMVTRLASGVDPNPDPFMRGWISDASLPFFDRSALRPLSRKVLSNPGLPVLRINGPAGAGRSYSTHVLGHLATLQARPTRVVSAFIPTDQAGVFTLVDLAEELAFQLSAHELPPQSGSSYAAQLARRILAWALEKPELHVFVIEGAGDPNISAEIVLFVSELAMRICAPAVRTRARLVLINHPQTLPSILVADSEEEQLQCPSRLSPSDLLPCLGELNAMRVDAGRAQLPVSLSALAEEMLAQAPPSGAARLRYLHEQLRVLLAS